MSQVARDIYSAWANVWRTNSGTTGAAAPPLQSAAASEEVSVSLSTLPPALTKVIERMHGINGGKLSQDELLNEVLSTALEYLGGVDKAKVFTKPVRWPV